MFKHLKCLSQFSFKICNFILISACEQHIIYMRNNYQEFPTILLDVEGALSRAILKTLAGQISINPGIPSLWSLLQAMQGCPSLENPKLGI